MSRQPIAALARLAAAWASPAVERRVHWRTLIGRDTWAVLLVTKGKPGESPERPMHTPDTRINPAWVRRTGGNLTAEQLVYERIGQHLRAHVQDDREVDVARAASIATTAVTETLAELGVDIHTLTRTDDTKAVPDA